MTTTTVPAPTFPMKKFMPPTALPNTRPGTGISGVAPVPKTATAAADTDTGVSHSAPTTPKRTSSVSARQRRKYQVSLYIDEVYGIAAPGDYAIRWARGSRVAKSHYLRVTQTLLDDASTGGTRQQKAQPHQPSKGDTANITQANAKTATNTLDVKFGEMLKLVMTLFRTEDPSQSLSVSTPGTHSNIHTHKFAPKVTTLSLLFKHEDELDSQAVALGSAELDITLVDEGKGNDDAGNTHASMASSTILACGRGIHISVGWTISWLDILDDDVAGDTLSDRSIDEVVCTASSPTNGVGSSDVDTSEGERLALEGGRNSSMNESGRKASKPSGIRRVRKEKGPIWAKHSSLSNALLSPRIPSNNSPVRFADDTNAKTSQKPAPSSPPPPPPPATAIATTTAAAANPPSITTHASTDANPLVNTNTKPVPSSHPLLPSSIARLKNVAGTVSSGHGHPPSKAGIFSSASVGSSASSTTSTAAVVDLPGGISKKHNNAAAAHTDDPAENAAGSTNKPATTNNTTISTNTNENHSTTMLLSNAEILAIREENDRLRAEVAQARQDLEFQLVAKKKAQDRVIAWEKENVRLVNKVDELEKQIQSSRDQKSAFRNEELQDSWQEVQFVKTKSFYFGDNVDDPAECTDDPAGCADCRVTLENNRDQLNAAKEEIERLQLSLAAGGGDYSCLAVNPPSKGPSELNQAKRENESLLRRVSELEAKARGLEDELTNAPLDQEMLRLLEMRSLEIQVLRKRIDELESTSRTIRLEEQLADSQSMNFALQAKLRAVNLSDEKVKKRIEELTMINERISELWVSFINESSNNGKQSKLYANKTAAPTKPVSVTTQEDFMIKLDETPAVVKSRIFELEQASFNLKKKLFQLQSELGFLEEELECQHAAFEQVQLELHTVREERRNMTLAWPSGTDSLKGKVSKTISSESQNKPVVSLLKKNSRFALSSPASGPNGGGSKKVKFQVGGNRTNNVNAAPVENEEQTKISDSPKTADAANMNSSETEVDTIKAASNTLPSTQPLASGSDDDIVGEDGANTVVRSGSISSELIEQLVEAKLQLAFAQEELVQYRNIVTRLSRPQADGKLERVSNLASQLEVKLADAHTEIAALRKGQSEDRVPLLDGLD